MDETKLEPVATAEMVAFGTSEHACYLYPGEDQQPLREAFIAGAAARHANDQLSASPAQPVASVGVKGLEWEQADRSEMHRARSVLGTYRVWTHHEAAGRWFWQLSTEPREVTASGTAEDPRAAKASAQADYEARIRSALVEAGAETEWPDRLHPSHKNVRGSDASTFDMICDDCGATDQVPGGWGSLRKPCTVNPEPSKGKE